jgi:hypothetical protein
MRVTFRKYSRHRLVHAIIIAVAVLIGVIIAFAARPTRGASPQRADFSETKTDITCQLSGNQQGHAAYETSCSSW